MTPPVLELDAVSAAYGPYRALFGVSVTVLEGATVALLGSNGAGKSTVARVASGLVPVTAGRVLAGGVDVTGKPAWRIARAGIAHVPEGRGVFSTLSVEENLVLSLRRRAGPRALRHSLEQAYLRFPALAERRHARAGTLSGGQQRLLSLAKVLVVPRKLLIADELSLGLAPHVVDDVYRALADVQRAGTALLIVEQSIDRVLSIATSAVVLDHGSVAYAGPATEAADVVAHVLAPRGRPQGADGAMPAEPRVPRGRGWRRSQTT